MVALGHFLHALSREWAAVMTSCSWTRLCLNVRDEPDKVNSSFTLVPTLSDKSLSSYKTFTKHKDSLNSSCRSVHMCMPMSICTAAALLFECPRVSLQRCRLQLTWWWPQPNLHPGKGWVMKQAALHYIFHLVHIMRLLLHSLLPRWTTG